MTFEERLFAPLITLLKTSDHDEAEDAHAHVMYSRTQYSII